MRLRGVDEGRVRAVTTSTVRQASNATTFLVGAEARLGFPIDVISGREEARLACAGVAHTMPCDATIRLVVNIGGGSTELIIGCGSQAIFTESVAVGSGTVRKRFFPNGRVESRALQASEQSACVQFARAARYVRQHSWHAAVGSSGTARMLARILKANGLNDGGRGGITYAGLLRLSLLLLDVRQVKRLKLEGLQPHRLGMLPGGLAVMLAAVKVFGIEDMVPSEPGLRFGLLHGLMHDGTPRR